MAVLTVLPGAACRLIDVEITDNLLLVLLAGFDTSSTTLTAVLANLQQHPAAADKLRGEQQAVLAKHGPGLSAAVLRDMPYAEAVVRWGMSLSMLKLLIGQRTCTQTVVEFIACLQLFATPHKRCGGTGVCILPSSIDAQDRASQ